MLSLFFIDKVENFLGDGVNNLDANGQFVQWFDELFLEERAKSSQWQELFPQDPADLRRGYFSVLKAKRGGTDTFQDTSGSTKADDDAYDLIMRDKARLLDQAEPVRFIFSHSALREGWDNPNVFQICTLREMGAEVERRQTIGRGLRLPVDQTGERVADRSIAQLTVIANESYVAFAKSLQTEYEKSGVEIGRVRLQEFSKIALYEEHIERDGPEYFGYERSKTLYEALESSGLHQGRQGHRRVPADPARLRPRAHPGLLLAVRRHDHRVHRPLQHRAVREAAIQEKGTQAQQGALRELGVRGVLARHLGSHDVPRGGRARSPHRGDREGDQGSAGHPAASHPSDPRRGQDPSRRHQGDRDRHSDPRRSRAPTTCRTSSPSCRKRPR